MNGQYVSDVYTPQIISVTPNTLVAEAISVMRASNISCLPVLENERAVGIFTERNIVRSAARWGSEFIDCSIGQLMSAPVVSTTLETSIQEAYHQLQVNKVRHLVVVDEYGRAIGVVSLTNLLEPLGLEYFVVTRRLAQIMIHDVVKIARSSTLTEAVVLMAEDSISCLFVVQDNRPLGILTERDVARLLAEGVDLDALKVEEVMSSPVQSAGLDMPVHEAVSLMRAKQIRRLAVVDQFSNILGLVTQSDIVSALRSKDIDVIKDIIREKEEKYRSLFENSSIGIFRATLDGHILVVNPALVDMLGYQYPRELRIMIVDLSKQLYVDAERRDELFHTVHAVASKRFETRFCRKDGKVVTTEMHVRCVCEPRSGAKTLEVFVEDVTERKKTEVEIQHRRDMLEDMVRDHRSELKKMNLMLQNEISERKQAEAALRAYDEKLDEMVKERTAVLVEKTTVLEEANTRLLEFDRLKSSFLSLVSHELRTPLTSIRGFAKLIRKDFQKLVEIARMDDQKCTSKAQRIDVNLGIIVQESERLTTMINDVLDLAKIESGRMEWRESEYFVPRLVDRAVDSVMGQYVQNPLLRLKTDVQENIPVVMVDADRLLQVLINLLSNAAKFTAAGEVRLTAHVVEEDVLQFCVADTGIGIPAEELDKIFDKFHQSTQGDQIDMKPQGTGLGLAICRQIVEHYGGRIFAESELGVGSSFYVALPLGRIRA